MLAGAAHYSQIAPSASIASAVSSLFVQEYATDGQRVSIPRPEIHIVVRFGPSARRGLDAHAFGARQRAHRKLIRGGQRTLMARLQLGAHSAILGVPGSAVSGRIVALEELWGEAAARRLCERLASARDITAAAAILQGAIAERLAHAASANGRSAHTQLALDSAALFARATANISVHSVADELGVSERHLRRVFNETLGVSPKAFARLTRFHRALRAACEAARGSWADIAAASGYYDQAHLIAEFRELSGVTPQVLLSELRAQPAIGGELGWRVPPPWAAASAAVGGAGFALAHGSSSSSSSSSST